MPGSQKPASGFLEQVVSDNGDSLVAMLQAIQDEHNYLPEDALRDLSRLTGIPLIEVYRAATFYNYFSLTPRGRHHAVVCTGTTCHVRGSEQVTEEICRCLGIRPGEVSEDGEFSLDTVNCLGCCAFAPVMVMDGTYYGNLSPGEARKILRSRQREQTPVAGR